MSQNVTQKLIASHLVDGDMEPGQPIGLRIDQTLTQDATGTLVMLELEAMGLDRVKTELSAQYVDHNLLQTDFRNADDHLFLRSACEKYGVWYSKPGNGISHVVHMERFGKPGRTLIGSDSHTPAGGSLGMLAIGAGGLEVAMAMAGEPFFVLMPKVLGVKLTGKLPDWVSAKDVILEMLRRYGVRGGRGKVIEYYGPGLEFLSAMDRHVIANMGTELGATTTVFPSDNVTRTFLKSQNRADDWTELLADSQASYDETDEIDLSTLEPLIALPSSPGNVERVTDVAGQDIYQAYIGSSANPGYRDFAVPAMMVDGRQVSPSVSFDVNPSGRQILENLSREGHLSTLIRAGARIHQAGCNGCIGMGQAPATEKISLRTVPRNFPGRSGTSDDKVYLCSPETATASAITGVITDPRTLGMPCPIFREPDKLLLNTQMIQEPASSAESVSLEKGPNIKSLPEFEPLPDKIDAVVHLKVGDDISTDEIMPAGQKVLPFRSNIPEMAKFAFGQVDNTFYSRAKDSDGSSLAVVAGDNYGQGSSREHAAIVPRYLGLRVVLARSFARIHRQNLINYGIVPLLLDSKGDWNKLEPGDTLTLEGLGSSFDSGGTIIVHNTTKKCDVPCRHDLSERESAVVRAGGLINFVRAKQFAQPQ